MAHSCPECYQACHCGGDIDDCFFEGTREELLCHHCPEDDSDEDYFQDEQYVIDQHIEETMTEPSKDFQKALNDTTDKYKEALERMKDKPSKEDLERAFKIVNRVMNEPYNDDVKLEAEIAQALAEVRAEGDEKKEEYLQKLEALANFLRGVSLDPRTPQAIKDVLRDRAYETDKFVESEL